MLNHQKTSKCYSEKQIKRFESLMLCLYSTQQTSNILWSLRIYNKMPAIPLSCPVLWETVSKLMSGGGRTKLFLLSGNGTTWCINSIVENSQNNTECCEFQTAFHSTVNSKHAIYYKNLLISH